MPLLVCQCRTIDRCISFFKEHTSKGHNMQSVGTSPTRALTVEEFIEANAHRNLEPELLRTRFRVADADQDGLLTPEEVESHRARAAENKRNAARG
jgi:Ca2+-binding EF-hand superfamily protein